MIGHVTREFQFTDIKAIPAEYGTKKNKIYPLVSAMNYVLKASLFLSTEFSLNFKKKQKGSSVTSDRF